MAQSIRSVVTDFRSGIIGKRKSDRMCFAVCAPLQTFLEMCGHKTELIEGVVCDVQHFWLRLPDGRIVDPTADQFTKPDGSPMPKVYIGELPAWYGEHRCGEASA